MPGYQTRCLSVSLGGRLFRIRALSDLQQFADPHGEAARVGISSAGWSLFGQLWPAGRLLAQTMAAWPLVGQRILEVGCGLGLSSLVLQARGADITASDHHPLAGPFLHHNAVSNGLPPPAYVDVPWSAPPSGLGRFDLIIGSDILYERGQAELLAVLLERHANVAAECLITDPGRGNSAAFSRAMRRQGYQVSQTQAMADAAGQPMARGGLLHYQR